MDAASSPGYLWSTMPPVRMGVGCVGVTEVFHAMLSLRTLTIHVHDEAPLIFDDAPMTSTLFPPMTFDFDLQ